MVEQLLEEEGGISLRDLTAREGAKRIISLSSPYSSSSVGETAGRTSTRTSSWLLALSSSHYYFLVTILPFLHSPESWTCSLSLPSVDFYCCQWTVRMKSFGISARLPSEEYRCDIVVILANFFRFSRTFCRSMSFVLMLLVSQLWD